MKSGASDAAIVQYIETQDSANYDHIIAQDDRWGVFYHLNEMRKALFSWYDLERDSSLLEIGGGFGALTGLFCEKCGNVVTIEQNALRAGAICKRHSKSKNFQVVCQDVLTWNNEERFDYIVMVGILETICNGSQEESDYIKVLDRIKRWLAPKGKLLIAVENRFGIRYWCGAADKYTGRPYSGINRYPLGSNGFTFDRKQMERILAGAGLERMKFFYPLPDDTLPQVIYSDEYLPDSSVKERVIPYYLDDRYLTAYENDLYDDIVSNRVLGFMANSFLIECSVDAERCGIVYAALTTDRGEEDGFATIIRNNGTVEKMALYKKGERHLERIYENAGALEKRGLHCVKQEWENGRLVMPFVQENTLCDDLRELLKQDIEVFGERIRQLYLYILNSSEEVAVSENRFRCPKELQEELGVILQKAYIDMVPMNCFFTDGGFLFFDQEFVKECYPAKYVLYRVLKYTYFFMPEAEKKLPLQTLKEAYGLEKLWQCFEEEERQFVAENRRYDIYKHFRRWAAVNRQEIYGRYGNDRS